MFVCLAQEHNWLRKYSHARTRMRRPRVDIRASSDSRLTGNEQSGKPWDQCSNYKESSE